MKTACAVFLLLLAVVFSGCVKVQQNAQPNQPAPAEEQGQGAEAGETGTEQVFLGNQGSGSVVEGQPLDLSKPPAGEAGNSPPPLPEQE